MPFGETKLFPWRTQWRESAKSVIACILGIILLPACCLCQTPNGLGASTFNCVDVDGDGYGVGEGCTGRDADDLDATIHTGAEAVTKYGTLTAFLSKLGYDPTNIYYISTSGTDTGSPPACKNNSAAPCATFGFVDNFLAADDMVIWRTGTYTEGISLVSGSSGSPTIYMA